MSTGILLLEGGNCSAYNQSMTISGGIVDEMCFDVSAILQGDRVSLLEGLPYQKGQSIALLCK